MLINKNYRGQRSYLLIYLAITKNNEISCVFSLEMGI